MDGHMLKRTLAVHQRIADAFNDDRFPVRGPNTRMLVVTGLWVVGIERPPPGERWDRVRDLLQLSPYGLLNMFREDAPRWAPTDEHGVDRRRVCEAPMVRRSGPCGQSESTAFRVTDPADGTWRIAGFCNRHREYAAAVQQAERVRRQSGTLPVPVPNTGGLLPCYLGGKREAWAENYARARPGWQPPAEGLRADDWPVMAKVVAKAAAPQLSLLEGDGETEFLFADGTGPPSLRLLPGGAA